MHEVSCMYKLFLVRLFFRERLKVYLFIYLFIYLLFIYLFGMRSTEGLLFLL